MKLLEVTKVGNIYVEDDAGNEWRFAFYDDGAVATQRKSSDGYWYASKASAAVIRFARKYAARKNPRRDSSEETFWYFGLVNSVGGLRERFGPFGTRNEAKRVRSRMLDIGGFGPIGPVHSSKERYPANVLTWMRTSGARSNPKKTMVQETFESFGFRITNTGGGSTAYERRIGRKGYALVTVDEDGTGFEVPKRLSEPTLLGLYKEYGDEGKLVRFPTLRALFQALSAGKIRELR